MQMVRDLLERVGEEADSLGSAVTNRRIVLMADPAGIPHVEIRGLLLEGLHSWRQQVESSLVIDLLSTFTAEAGLRGPNLVEPGKGLRIIPGKLCGEPHVKDTRIETRVLRALNLRGFTAEQLAALYPELTGRDIESALSLERDLEQNVRAAA
jgi:uncharacterized protein (DUF433 family)